VVISGRHQKSLDDAIKELGAGVVAVRSDVSKLSDLDTLFNLVVKKLGRIDLGMPPRGGFAIGLERLTAQILNRFTPRDEVR
jgi:hypothetical protein